MAGERSTTGGNNHRAFWHAFIVFTVLVIPSAAAADDRPNILWIIAEDLGPEQGSYAHPEARTPRLDRLASRVQFAGLLLAELKQVFVAELLGHEEQ